MCKCDNNNAILRCNHLTTEIPEEFDKSLDECKEVGHDELFEVSPLVEDILHHDTSILHSFEDLFMWKESARDEGFNFFKFISPTINMWV